MRFPRIHNITDVPAWRLCMGCGACYAACVKGGVRLVNIEDEGIRPIFDDTLCHDCADCLGACPGWRVDADMVMEDRPKTTEADHEFGQTLELWEGYAADPEIRHNASSGGLLSALALFCLEREGMRFALHAGMDPETPYLNKTFQSQSRDELLARCGSRYAPASPCDGLRLIAESDGPCIFIGKPCDAAAAGMLRRQLPELDRNLGLVLSFCCAGTPSTRGTLDLLASLNVAPSKLASLRYRGNGWPGEFTATPLDAPDSPSIPYMEAWGRLTKYVAPRCRFCPDGLGRLSDITCGDAWESYTEGTHDPGRSIVLVRTTRGQEILRKAREAGYVILEPISPDAVLQAQRSLLSRRRELFGRLLALRLFLIPTPRFNGFSLHRNWSAKPLREKFRSVTETMKRIIKRKLWRPIRGEGRNP